MNVIPRDKQPYVTPHRLVVLIALILFSIITACTPPNDSTTATDTDAKKPIMMPTPTMALPDPALAPPAALIEQPLHGLPARVPEVWLVPSLQSKEALAAHLMTDVEQLDWVNPGLPAQVSPGTLVVIPSSSIRREYRDGNPAVLSQQRTGDGFLSGFTGDLARARTASSVERLLAVDPSIGRALDLLSLSEKGGR